MAGEHRIRRVGFRDGTDEELRAIHAVESPIEAERRHDHVPQPLDAFLAFARALPSQWHDHAWLVEDAEGAPIGSCACWFHEDGDPRVMFCDVFVHRDHRRRGIGSELLAAICDETTREGRSLLTWSTFDAVPAGEALARRVGGRPGRVNRTSELALADVDWAMVGEWAAAPRAQELGYRLEVLDGVFPPHLRSDAVTFHRIMESAPRDDLDIADRIIDEGFVEQLDRHIHDSGRTRWTMFVRDRDGVCVGGTEVVFEPWEPTIALQQNTGIDPAHRGVGLAKWVKAAMLDRIRAERPEVARVQTGNAFSNAPMLAINDALGFVVVATQTDWQADVDTVRRALAS